MVGTPARRTIRFARPDLCWPLLFHLEPLLTAHVWMTEFSVTVTDDQGTRSYADVAQARSGSEPRPPHRVEMYATYRSDHASFKHGVWMVGFGEGQQPAVTAYSEQGMKRETNELRLAIIEFLGRSDAPAEAVAQPRSEAPERGGSSGRRWQWITNQPLAVQIIGGLIATLGATAIVAIITVLLR